MAFQFKKLKIPDVILIEPQVFGDARGYFMETYKFSEFKNNGANKPFVQTNHSKSKKGVLRGLHYQLNPKAQGKLIRAISGKLFDVAVDIRKNSPTYGKWVGETLSAENKKTLYIPEGFAHGFCVLSETADILYSCTEEYSPEHEHGIMWNDPRINIHWPIESPLISERDKNLTSLDNANNNFEYADTQ